jgi:H+/Cl- antiporter ClcA
VITVGLINYSLPLTVGNGNMLLSKVVKYGAQKLLSKSLLISSAFGRAVTLGVSMSCIGFVGGIIFPIISIGTFAGVICFYDYDYIPYGLCISCFLAGIPGGICPMPLTLSCLAIFLFYFGAYQSAPIFISALTSYTIVSGSGLLPTLQARQRRQELEREKEKKMLAKKKAALDQNIQPYVERNLYSLPDDEVFKAQSIPFDHEAKDSDAPLSLLQYLDHHHTNSFDQK